MSTVNIAEGQEFVYSVEIVVFRDREWDWSTRDYGPWVDYPEGKVVAVGLYSTAAAARNYGSYRTGGVRPVWDSERRRLVGKPRDPNTTYRIKRHPISMGEGVEIPQLKVLSD